MDAHDTTAATEADRYRARAGELADEALLADQAGDRDRAVDLRLAAGDAERAAVGADCQHHVYQERRRAHLAATVITRHQAAAADQAHQR